MWQGLVFLFCASIFTSKSGLSIFGLLLLLVAAFKLDWKEFFKRKDLVFAVSLYPLAAFCNLFSLGGWQSSLKVLISWPWPLLVIPGFYIARRPQDWKAGLAGLFTGFVIACGNALVIFFRDFNGQFNSAVRVASFWDIGRWAYFLACTSIILFAFWGDSLIKKKNFKKVQLPLGLCLAISLAFLVLANSRGPWIGTLIGIVFLAISSKKYLKLSLGLAAIGTVAFVLVPGVSERFKSSFSAKTENGVVTSTDASNAGRLHMWKVNADFFKENVFFGTGFESAEKPLRAFIQKQSAEYQKNYIDPEFSFRDQHNSFLWILVQMGVIFFIVFAVGFASLLLKPFLLVFKSDSVAIKASVALMVAQLAMFMFYSAVTSYEMVWFFPLWVLLREQLKDLQTSGKII